MCELLDRLPHKSEFPYTNHNGYVFSYTDLLQLYKDLAKYSYKLHVNPADINVEATESILYVLNTYDPEKNIDLTVYTKYVFRMYMYKMYQKVSRKLYTHRSQIKNQEPIHLVSYDDERLTTQNNLSETIDFADIKTYINRRYNNTYGQIFSMRLNKYTQQEIGDKLNVPKATVNRILHTIRDDLQENY